MGGSGLIGTTLQEQFKFDLVFNSKDVHQIDKLDLNGCNIWLSCLPATKWKVNENIEEDIYNMQYIIKLLHKQKFNNIILFSTIDVYEDSPTNNDENYTPNISSFKYGTNRRLFEILVTQFLNYTNLKIFRLPALFGKHIKKNIVYDLLNNNQVDKVKSNSWFQWYDLTDLYQDVNSRLATNITLYNLFPEPIRTSNIVKLFPEFANKVDTVSQGQHYDFKTVYTTSGYLHSKEDSLAKLTKFIYETRNK